MTARTNNTLTRKLARQLEDFVKDNLESLTGKGYQHAADVAATTVGFPVTVANIAAAVDVLELGHALQGRRGTKPGSGNPDKDKWYIIARELVRYFEHVDYYVDPQLRAVSKKQAVPDAQ